MRASRDGLPRVELDPLERRTFDALERELRILDRALAAGARARLVADSRDVGLWVANVAVLRRLFTTALEVTLVDGRRLRLRVYRGRDCLGPIDLGAAPGCTVSCVVWDEPVGWSITFHSALGECRMRGFLLDVEDPPRYAGASTASTRRSRGSAS